MQTEKYFFGIFLILYGLLISACGSDSDSSDTLTLPDMRGNWTMTVYSGLGSFYDYTVGIIITSYNFETGEFEGRSQGRDDYVSSVEGSIRWAAVYIEGPGQVVVDMRIIGGDPIFCPFIENSILGVNYRESEMYRISGATDIATLVLDPFDYQFIPHNAFRDGTARHRYKCSEVSGNNPPYQNHEIQVTLVKSTQNYVFYETGESGPAGGIVFIVTDGGLHGLEAAPEDQAISGTPRAEWGCFPTLIPGADGTAVGAGAQNTADILAGCMDTPIAADLAAGYSLNGFSDWFLPSKEELNELYSNRSVVGGFDSAGNDLYWSSSEASEFNAWARNLCAACSAGLVQFLSDKSESWRVRAVRAF